MDKRILIIDNHIPVNDAIRDILESDCTDVVHVKSVREALEVFLNQEFSLVILDVAIPECDGYRLLEVMQTAKPIPILVLSSKAEEYRNDSEEGNKENRYIQQDSLKLARHFMMSEVKKNTDKSCCCYTLVCGNDLLINPNQREVLLKGCEIKLTKTEFDLLFCLASHPGQVLSREQIYRQVWSDEALVNVDEVVKAHIKSLRKKLAPADIEYIQNVWGVGYRFQPDGTAGN